jgi:hypothetical protein
MLPLRSCSWARTPYCRMLKMLKHVQNPPIGDTTDRTILADIFALQDPILGLLKKAGVVIEYSGYEQEECRMTLPYVSERFHFSRHQRGGEFEACVNGAMAVPVEDIPKYIARLNNSTECLQGYLAITILTARLEGKI